jgi:phosphate transport system protein
MKTDLQLSTHISKRYNAELEQVRSLVAEMGQLVLQQVEQGVQSIVHLDSALAEQIIKNDEKVNAFEIKIDEACTHILATRQPAASDLRMIVCVIKVVTDLERIGDEAIKLGRNAIKINNSESSSRTFIELKHLGEQVITNLQQAIKAYVNLDVESALRVFKQDESINDEFDNISRLLITKMMEDPREIKNALRITWCARALERIGDHAQNVSEYIVYLVKGKDVRHSSLAEIKATLGKV